MACEVTIYWRRSKSTCPHPDVAECSACRIGLCSAHIVECDVCEQALCGDCIIEHRTAHDLRKPA
jgi:predicted sulfurtransferase